MNSNRHARVELEAFASPHAQECRRVVASQRPPNGRASRASAIKHKLPEADMCQSNEHMKQRTAIPKINANCNNMTKRRQ